MTPIHFVESGKGFPIVLLHGFCESHEIWPDLVPELVTGYRVLMPDLPGFGKSPLLKHSFELHDIAHLLFNWLDELRIDQCVLIGHSLGGYITLDMANHQPNRFKGIGLFHSTTYPDSPEKKQSRDAVNEFVEKHGVKAFIKIFVPGLFHKPDHLATREVFRIANEAPAASIIGYNNAMKNRPSQVMFIKEYQRPILIIAGLEDKIITHESLLEQQRLNPLIDLYVLEQTGHMGMYENKEKSVEIIRNFIELSTF